MRFLRDNGLSIAFWLLFVAAMAGNMVAVIALVREEPATHQAGGHALAPLASAEFLRGVLGNWQAALLQLLALILLATVLRQRGAAHSREPQDEAAREALAEPPKSASGSPDRWPHGWPGLYAHSLSLAFSILFAASFAAFVLVDRVAVNQDRVRHGEPAFGIADFLGSARFWFDLLQTWQAEFFAMAVFLLLSIFLREKGSPESKAVGASDRDTGDVNE
jgi:hypothetical protein